MITSLVEPGGARPGDETRRVVILTMLAYTALAAIFAGAASIGAGLAVLALGMLFTLLIDMRQWRDIVEHDRRNAPPASPRAALPPRERPEAIALSGPAPAKAITSTRLLPYERAQEPVLVVAAEEPAVIALEAEAETVPAPAPKVQRQPKKPSAD
jgi:hypothetical protein